MSIRAIKLICVLVLFGIIVLIFLPSAGNDFVEWDDHAFVVKNPHIQTISLRSLMWMATTFYQGAWHPVTWLSHATDLAVGGTNPAYHHIINVLIHALNVIIFFLLTLKLQYIADVRSDLRLITAFTAALLFGIHPLRVESVAWVAERKDVLCSLFYLGSLFAYISYAQSKLTHTRGGYYCAALALAILACMSKSMAITLPVTLILLDYFPLNRISRLPGSRRIIDKAPFFIVAVISGVLGTMAATETSLPLSVVPIDVRIMNAFYGIVFYLQKSLLPQHLSPLYQLEVGANYFSPKYIGSALFVIAITIATVWKALKGERLWLTVWLWYLILLAPALGFFLPYRHAFADRYSYLPTLSLWLLVGIGVAWLWNWLGDLKLEKLGRALVVVLVSIIALVYGIQTRGQISVWKNSDTLWSNVIARSDPVPAVAYFGKGKALEDKGNLDAAMAQYQLAYSANPGNARYLAKIADVMARKGDLGEALRLYEQIRDKDPSNPVNHVNIGRVLSMMGRHRAAINEFDRALALDPENARAWGLSAMVYIQLNDRPKALQCYKKYLALGYPRSSTIEEQLGIIR